MIVIGKRFPYYISQYNPLVSFCKGLSTRNCTNIFAKGKYIQYIQLKVCKYNRLFRIDLKLEKNVNL